MHLLLRNIASVMSDLWPLSAVSVPGLVERAAQKRKVPSPPHSSNGHSPAETSSSPVKKKKKPGAVSSSKDQVRPPPPLSSVLTLWGCWVYTAVTLQYILLKTTNFRFQLSLLVCHGTIWCLWDQGFILSYSVTVSLYVLIQLLSKWLLFR